MKKFQKAFSLCEKFLRQDSQISGSTGTNFNHIKDLSKQKLG